MRPFDNLYDAMEYAEQMLKNNDCMYVMTDGCDFYVTADYKRARQMGLQLWEEYRKERNVL